jgi:dTDP-4-amino-4,6-dideoxygalactose transaminase
VDNPRSRGKDLMTIYCANPAAQFFKCQNEIELAVLKVLRSGQYILGIEVDAFENE